MIECLQQISRQQIVRRISDPRQGTGMRDKLQQLNGTGSLSQDSTLARSAGLMFLVVVLAGALLALPSINVPFFWDDLHLIRVHTPAELAAGWTGTFNSDHIETAGFRPLTNYFNHFRALAFGNSTTAHRLFLLVLFSLFLTLVGILANWFFDGGLVQLVLGGILGLFHVYSVYHYFWISDGIHLLLGIFMLAAMLSFLETMRSGRPAWLLLSALCTALALLTREDALALYPLLLYLGAGFVWLRRRKQGELGKLGRALAVSAAVMLLELAAYWYWRSQVVPNAGPLGFDPLALAWAAGLTVENVGGSQILNNPWPAYGLVLLIWNIWLGVFLLVALFALKGAARYAVLFWAGAALIGMLPVLVLARANLLLLPVAFWGLLVAKVLTEAWRSSDKSWLRGLVVVMTVLALAAPAYGTFAFERELRPNNINWMCRNADLLYGVTGNATIAPGVRAAVQADLSAYGITDLSSFESRLPALERKAQADGRYGFNPQGLPFIPRFRFLPQLGLHPHCEPPG